LSGRCLWHGVDVSAGNDLFTTGGWTRDRFAHEGFFFDSDAMLAERCIPFLESAFDEDDPVVFVASEETTACIAQALGADVLSRCVVLSDSADWWRGDAFRTLTAYARAMDPLMETGRPWRLIGEPTWLDEPDGERWSRLESACNATFATLPYYSLCLHDLRRLSAASVRRARESHPCVVCDGAIVDNPDFVEPSLFLRAAEPAWDDALVDVTGVIDRVGDARSLVRELCGGEVSEHTLSDIVMAVSELVTNSLEYAATAAALRAWTTPTHVVVEIADTGRGFDATFAGYVPPSPANIGGRGLWLARAVSDDLTIRQDEGGTAVRVFFRRRSVNATT
jgi:anti-sigma regulatory factor (Ser/Thr protein kinase)